MSARLGEETNMPIAADYPFLDVLWTMLVFTGLVIWFWLLIKVFADVFRRHDVGGWGKAGWILLMIVLPFLGVLIYLIAHGKDMGKRDVEQLQASQAQFDEYVRSVAADGGATAEIERAKALLDSGAIDQAEFEALKAKAVAT
jgi:Short C-terminal domain/Phospholipase_D-nuclease N-terminal